MEKTQIPFGKCHGGQNSLKTTLKLSREHAVESSVSKEQAVERKDEEIEEGCVFFWAVD